MKVHCRIQKVKSVPRLFATIVAIYDGKADTADTKYDGIIQAKSAYYA